MPQAPEELRERWGGHDGIGDDKACDFLEARGWKLTRAWEWLKPTPDHEPTKEEVEAIIFLICEWDYGGITDGAQA